ncbi:MAG: cobalamin B12-binding domain-containing protein [Chloroflexi bacterium]|nr:cobalamin B12-binding domain-containing protein [Chloroflexota bacterium]
MPVSEQLVKAISDLQEDEALRLVQQGLATAEDPNDILSDCQKAMNIVGDRFAKSEYFVPELIMSGEVIKKIFDIVKPKLAAEGTSSGVSRKGKIVLGTVRGDIHNIGKDIVGFMLDISGFEVHDLGVDVPEEKFVQAIKEVKPQVVALSGLLTSVYDTMKSTVDAIKQAGLRSKVKIMIGGGQMDDRVKDYSGADAYGKDAMAAVWLAKEWVP